MRYLFFIVILFTFIFIFFGGLWVKSDLMTQEILALESENTVCVAQVGELQTELASAVEQTRLANAEVQGLNAHVALLNQINQALAQDLEDAQAQIHAQAQQNAPPLLVQENGFMLWEKGMAVLRSPEMQTIVVIGYLVFGTGGIFWVSKHTQGIDISANMRPPNLRPTLGKKGQETVVVRMSREQAQAYAQFRRKREE